MFSHLPAVPSWHSVIPTYFIFNDFKKNSARFNTSKLLEVSDVHLSDEYLLTHQVLLLSGGSF